MVDTKLKL